MIGRSKKVKKVGIDWNAIAAAGGIAKGPSTAMAKGWKKAEKERRLAEAYEVVNKRDGNRSRITGIELSAESSDPKRRREHNHLQERSTHPELTTDPSNIFLCSSYEHKFLTTHDLEIEGKDANARLVFHWNRNTVKPGKEPFRLLSKRRSQNRPAA